MNTERADDHDDSLSSDKTLPYHPPDSRSDGDSAAAETAISRLPISDNGGATAEWGVSSILAGLKTPAFEPGQLVEATAEWQAAAPGGWRYSIIREHAEGGLGKILIALDTDLRRRVALKEIKPRWQGDDPATRRFLKEAQITGQLEHPNIVPVYELNRRPGDNQPFYTMRFVEGSTLGDAIAAYHAQRRGENREDTLEFRRLLDAFVSVCNAIAYAHSRGVIHRDLKPANVALGEFGVVVVLDWGLAKILADRNVSASEVFTGKAIQIGADSQTQTAGASGTPAYMSPEQAAGRGDQADARTDVYGLGAILFEILAGRPPVAGKNASETMRRIVEEETPRVKSVRGDIPKVLDAICARAMAKKPDDRYPSADALGEDVRRWLADEPVSAASDPLSVRIRRGIRKHPALAASAASMILMAALAMAAFGGLQKQYSRKLENANQDLIEANRRITKANSDLTQSHNEIAELNQNLTKANQLAEEELDLAMEAIRSFYGEVAEETVLNNPALEKLRFRLLDVPQGFYKRLSDKLTQSNVGSDANQRRLGTALINLAKINRLKGSTDAAAASFLEAIKILEPLTQSQTDSTEPSKELARAYNEMGELYRMTDRIGQAEQSWSKSLAILKSLVQALPNQPDLKNSLAAAQNNLGAIYQATNRIDEAEAAWSEALAIQKQLVKNHPNSAPLQDQLTAFQINLGFLHHTANRLDKAEAFYREAAETLKPLARANPRVESYRHRLGTVLNNSAFVHKTLGRLSEAEKCWAEALDVRNSIVRARPTVAQFQSELAAVHNNLGYLRQTMNRMPQAEASYYAALAILEPLTRTHPTVAEYREVLADTYNNLGLMQASMDRAKPAEESHLEAVTVYASLVRDNPAVKRRLTVLSAYYSNLAWDYSAQGRLQEAEKTYRRALGVLEEAAKTSASPDFERQRIAQTRFRIGSAHQKMGRLSEAEQDYEAALAIQRPLASENPSPFHLNPLGSTLLRLGMLQAETKRPREAEKSLREALGLFEQEQRAKQTESRDQIAVAEACGGLGALISAQGRPEEALPLLDRAESILQNHPRDQPRTLEAQSRQRDVHRARAEAYQRLGRSQEADADRAKAASYNPPPDELKSRIQNAVKLAYDRRHADAAREAQDLAKNSAFAKEPGIRYSMACVIALAAEAALNDEALDPGERDRRARNYSEAAVAILRQLEQDGYFRNDARRELLMNDVELHALRSQTDFVAWMGDLIFPVNPFQR